MSNRFWIVLGGGAAMSGSILSGALVGWWLDGRVTPPPVGVAAGTIVGTCVGLWELWRLVGRSERR